MLFELFLFGVLGIIGVLLMVDGVVLRIDVGLFLFFVIRFKVKDVVKNVIVKIVVVWVSIFVVLWLDIMFLLFLLLLILRVLFFECCRRIISIKVEIIIRWIMMIMVFIEFCFI